MSTPVALVTGGAKGIGRAIVEKLAKAGYRVYFTYKSSKEAAQPLAGAFAKGTVNPVFCDVTNADQVAQVVDQILEKEETLDVLVNNAGIIRDGLFVTMSDEDWQAVLNTNLGSVYHFCKACVRQMMMQGNGSIVNVSSIVGQLGGAGQTNYSASKGAIDAFTRSLALELAGKNIRVNAVAPGFVDTDMTAAVRQIYGQEIKHRIPLGKYARPDDIAEVVCFLASSASSYITGQVVSVDGGLGLLNKR